MRIIDDTFIIGIDSGYGNIKTANCCFPASVSAYDTEPVFRDNMLVYGKRFYLIGEGHKEFLADKTSLSRSPWCPDWRSSTWIRLQALRRPTKWIWARSEKGKQRYLL